MLSMRAGSQAGCAKSVDEAFRRRAVLEMETAHSGTSAALA